MSSNSNQCSILKGILQNGSALNYQAARFGHVPKREKAKVLVAIPPPRVNTPESKVMAEMSNDTQLIETIVKAHFDTCDYTRNKMDPILQKARSNPNWITSIGPACPMKGNQESSVLGNFSEIFMDHVRQVCTFAKLIPGFKGLHHDDQVVLLKSCVFEVLLARLAGLFDNQSLVCLNGDIIHREIVQQLPPGNAKIMMESVFIAAQKINHLRLSDAEIGLLCAIVIISPDRAGLRNQELVQQMQTKLKTVLTSILIPQHLDQGNIFHELMTVIHDLRSLNTLHSEKFLQQCKFPGPTRAEDEKLNGQRYQPTWEIDRDSAGNGSPPSSDGQSSCSLEDVSSRRSPVESVSSTESIGPSNVPKLYSNDLKVNGSMLMNALIAPSIPTYASLMLTEGNLKISRPVNQCPSTSSSMSSRLTRELEYVNHSGLGSMRNANKSSLSTNTSVCSSPRSLIAKEEKTMDTDGGQKKRIVTSTGSREDRHPLLKRALQQPALGGHGLSAGMCGTVMNFKDEVYKPHKKFRRNTGGNCSSDEFPTSTQTGLGSPPLPKFSIRHVGSLLASQLSEPPKYLSSSQRFQSHRHFLQQREERAEGGNSLLATTLTRVTTAISNEESRRNEILAKLILEGNLAESFSGLPRCALGNSSSANPTPSLNSAPEGFATDNNLSHHPMSDQSSLGLLMCVPSYSTSEIDGLRKKTTLNKVSPQLVEPGTKADSKPRESVTSSPGDFQPLNLSTRTPPPLQPTSSTPKSRQDIPTEA